MLDTILSDHPSIVGVGELTYIFQDWPNDRRRCSCGNRYPDCPFWGGLSDVVTDMGNAESVLRQVEHRSLLAHLERGSIRDDIASEYRDVIGRLFNYVRRQSGRPIVLDSSKSARDAAGRPLALAMICGEAVDVVHMIRNPYATMQSYRLRGSNWALEGHAREKPLLTYRAAVGWLLANRIAAGFEKRPEFSSYTRLWYDELVSASRSSFAHMSLSLDLDLRALGEKVASGHTFHARHTVGGNRARFSGVQVQSASEDNPLPWHLRMCFDLLGGRTHRRLRQNVPSSA